MSEAVNIKADDLRTIVVDALEDIKAQDIRVLNVTGISSFTDLMVIASGNTTRQVKALANNVIEKVKAAGVTPIGVEGENAAEWVLIDLGDVVVHVMVPQIRDFYNLEKLWTVEPGPVSEDQEN